MTAARQMHQVTTVSDEQSDQQPDEAVVEYRRGSERWGVDDNKQWQQTRGAPNPTPPPADPGEAVVSPDVGPGLTAHLGNNTSVAE